VQAVFSIWNWKGRRGRGTREQKEEEKGTLEAERLPFISENFFLLQHSDKNVLGSRLLILLLNRCGY
jgi:hypothetical protein